MSRAMIKYVEGDLLMSPEKLIAHGCNARRVMGKGVAKLIREKFPHAYSDYMVGSQRLGDVIFSQGPEKIIANAITQDGYGSSYTNDRVIHADYNAIGVAFKTINRYCVENGISEIAIPKIGAGLAGGDWGVIERVIVDSAPDIIVKCYVLP